MSYNEALSQPVAYTDREELESMRGPNADTYANLWTIPHGCGQDLALYSQEYVTALLAALEEKDQRIAELEREKTNIAMLCADTCAKAKQKNDELEQRLQKPIKPPKFDGSEDVAECVFKFCSAINEAGFKVEVK